MTLIEKLDTGGTGSLFAVKRECERRGLPLTFHVITHEDYEIRPGNLRRLLILFTVKAYYMATSSYIFLNDNFMPQAYTNLAPETIVVQLWHGIGSFKKFGGSAEQDPRVLAELKKANENVTHILASSVHIRKNYEEAFCVPEQKVLVIGCPQADYYFEEHDAAGVRKKLTERFPKLKDKKLALYAPTFRDDEKRDRELLSHFDFAAFDEACGEEYCLIVRLHPQVKTASVPAGVPDLSDYPNVRELLLVTDLLIADYSSIAVEFSLLNRPILLYAFDKDWYLGKDRGFYFDYDETAPGPVAVAMEELISLVKNHRWDPEKVRAFAALHDDYYDAGSARRVCEFYFGKERGSLKIIAGLGNPTDAYKETRHNIGFMALDRISAAWNIPINQHKHKAMVGNGWLGGQRVLLVKPLTYMNLSGESLRAVMDFYKADPEDLLVIYDDISLDPGMLRIRKKGSSGGHNGMKSIIRHLGFDTFPRIRVGIGGNEHPGQDLADYVLSRFPREEKECIDEALDKVVKAAEYIAAGDIDEAMNRYSVGKKQRALK